MLVMYIISGFKRNGLWGVGLAQRNNGEVTAKVQIPTSREAEHIQYGRDEIKKRLNLLQRGEVKHTEAVACLQSVFD